MTFDRAALIRLREARGLTQRELARHAGLRPRTISRLESGKESDPPASTVGLIAMALSGGELRDPILRQLLGE